MNHLEKLNQKQMQYQKLKQDMTFAGNVIVYPL